MANPKSEQNWRLQQSEVSTDIGTGDQPTHLDLFSGIGGFSLAAQWAGFRTIGFCEIDKYCQKVLAKNFLGNTSRSYGWNEQGSVTQTNGEGRLPESDRPSESPRLIPNIFDLDGRQFSGVSLITGGFPCQPFSVAGKLRGAADDRAIWPEMFRVIKEARPAWVLGENVPGIIGMELDNVLSDLEGIGYATRAFVIPACAVDARHRRDRVWIVARNISNSAGGRCKQCDAEPESENGIICAGVPDSERDGLAADSERGSLIEESRKEPARAFYAQHFAGAGLPAIPLGNVSDTEHATTARQRQHSGHGLSESEPVRSGPCCWDDEREWSIKSGMGRVAHGIPYRVDRLKGLGNAIVPQLAYQVLREIRKLI